MVNPLEIEKAHRFGGTHDVSFNGRFQHKSRPIVCRFKTSKDRESVKKCGKNLSGTPFVIREQFPKEINERRKNLWPHYKAAKQQKRKVSFIRDKLYVDGIQVIADDKIDMDVGEQAHHGARPKTTKKTTTK